MKTYILPFTEYQRGWYEIEAESLEHAKTIVELGDFTETCEPFYKDGLVEWDKETIVEKGN